MNRARVKIGDRVLAFLLSVVMVLAMIPISSLTAPKAVAEGTDTVEVQVNLTGTAEVSVNNSAQNSVTVAKNTEVPVQITPPQGSYIKKLTFNGETVEVEKYGSYVYTVLGDTDVVIAAEIMKEYTVTTEVTPDEGGTVTLDGEVQTSLTVDENTDIPVAVQSNEGYQISSVTISGEPQTITDIHSFTTTYTVVADTEIKAIFVKEYTVTVESNENGTVVTDPALVGGSVVTVADGANVKITATPNTNYRVSQVLINGVKDDTVTGDNFAVGDKYEKTLAVDQNYTLQITFALNRYSVTANQPDNGSVEIDQGMVDYGGTAKVILKPNEGYVLQTVQVNGTDPSVQTDENGAYFIQIENITANQSVTVTFTEVSAASIADVSFDYSGAVRINEPVYVFDKDTAVVFETTKNGIRINGNIGSNEQNTVSISETTLVEKIELYYQAEGELTEAWHSVAEISETAPVKIVIDKEAPESKLIPEQANGNGYYHSDVSVYVSVTDNEDYSGINSVEYWITNGTAETEHKTIYAYEPGSEIKRSYAESITVHAAENNSDNVTVYLKVIDRAGNEKTVSVPLKINTTAPQVSVSIDGTLHAEAKEGYYHTARTATVTYVDRASTFDEVAALNGIVIEAKNAKGEAINLSKAAMIEWAHDGDTHTATIHFNVDGNYEWSVSYTNKAGLSNQGVTVTGDSPYRFAVDTAAPSGKITLESSVWDKLVSILTFGLFKNHSVTVVAEGSDPMTGISQIVYYKANETSALSIEQLDALFAEDRFEPTAITVDTEEKFAVYARITDFAGNSSYISTDGVIYDNTQSVITLTLPEANQNGYFNNDVVIPVSVNDAVKENVVYSGIRSITYTVEDEKEKTQEGVLFTWENGDLTANWSGNITVDSKKSNSDHVKVTVRVTDNAGNEAEKFVTLAINSDKPTATIDFTDSAVRGQGERGYYSAVRKATITIVDRASTFDAANATKGISVSAVDGYNRAIELTESDVVISDWSSDGNKHTATVTFQKDGNYTWSFAYTNKAGNKPETIVTEANDYPYTFTVDRGSPSGTVTINTKSWSQLLSALTFGLYSNSKVDVSVSASDSISPVYIEYFETDNPNIMTVSELGKQNFQTYRDYSVESDRQFVVYVRITDYAGNYRYISSDGYIVDTTASSIVLTPSAANGFYDGTANSDGQYGIYNAASKVTVDVSVTEADPHSGIRSIEYWVENDKVRTQSGTLFSFDVASPTYSDLVSRWNGSISVDKELNDGCNVAVYVSTVDNAGEESTNYVQLDIDNTAPKIEVSFDNNSDNAGNGYFNARRTATVTITERTHHFDETAATAGIIINAVDGKGNAVSDAYRISSWKTENNAENSNATKHTATISFAKDANYTWSISYTDKAGNINDGVDVGNSVSAFAFTVDTTAPTGTVKAVSAEGRATEWDTLRNALTFGFWSKEKIKITGTSADVTSPIAKVEYYKVKATSATDGTTALQKKDLDAVTNWTQLQGLEITEDEQFTVYLKITDYAGNYSYLSTNGLIVDHNAPMEELIAPEITIEPLEEAHDIYNGDVKIGITVTDPLVGGTYSGLRTVTYQVLNLGVETQSGTLYTFEHTDPKQSDLLQTWTGEITVDSTLNNSNDVVIVVYAEDNSQNGSERDKEIKIDVTKPTIDISYDNNDADMETYFKAERTATIVVTERNFDASDVEIVITNTDGVTAEIGTWTKTEGSGNSDDTKWTATVAYRADGDYTFEIAFTDLAGNGCEEVRYGDSVAPTAFTIDQTVPTVSVSYNNNDARNGNYYNAVRTATIVLNEHNFDAERVTILITATDDGAETTRPTVSGWSSDGDRHTATVYYGTDARYTFDIDVRDMAGNASADYAEETFFVDMTMPALEISGVENNSANKGEVIPVISYSDTNYDENNVSITLSGANRKEVKPEGSYANIHNGRVFTFQDFAEEKAIDDIYTLTATLTDKAGNTTTETIMFSVNRFGSTYALSEAAEQMNGTYMKVSTDIVITETNADELSNIKVTRFKDGAATVLTEGSDYEIQLVGGEGQWYHYTYRIFEKNFAEDGVYSLTIESDDKTGSKAKSDQDTKDAAITFGIDSTLPLVNIANLESKTTYAQDSITVEMSVMDNLKLSKVVVELDGSEYHVWDGEELDTIIRNGGNFSFDISGDSTEAHNLVVYAIDAAGNGEKLSDEVLPANAEAVSDFYVTTNVWVRYYTNKPLFYGSIATVVLTAGATVSVVVYKKKKKEAILQN